MAKETNSQYNREYYIILKAMGISGRNPVENEISLMDTWLKDYGFTLDIVQEACSRTVLATGQPSFPYADKILSGWKDKSVKNLSDIRQLDAQRQQRKLEKQKKHLTKETHLLNLPVRTDSIIFISENTTSTNMKRNY